MDLIGAYLCEWIDGENLIERVRERREVDAEPRAAYSVGSRTLWAEACAPRHNVPSIWPRIVPFASIATSPRAPVSVGASPQATPAEIVSRAEAASSGTPLPTTPGIPEVRAPLYTAPFVDLQVLGFGDGVVSTLDNSDDTPPRARPVVVALHGLRGRADWTCHLARQLFSARAAIRLGSGTRAFAANGGKRVLFVCGTQACFDGAREAVRVITVGGAAAGLGYAKGAGHRSWGPIVNVMRDKLDWLLEGDARFRSS